MSPWLYAAAFVPIVAGIAETPSHDASACQRVAVGVLVMSTSVYTPRPPPSEFSEQRIWAGAEPARASSPAAARRPDFTIFELLPSSGPDGGSRDVGRPSPGHPLPDAQGGERRSQVALRLTDGKAGGYPPDPRRASPPPPKSDRLAALLRVGDAAEDPAEPERDRDPEGPELHGGVVRGPGEHPEEHRAREVGVRPRGEVGLPREGRLLRGGEAVARPGDQLLLRGPDDEPDVEPHHRAEEHPEEDPHPAVGHPPVRVPEEAVGEVDLPEEAEPGEEGDHRAPPEPPQGAREERGVDLLLRLLVDRPLEGDVHEVEEVEVPDPDDPREDVGPAEDQLEELGDVHGGSFRVPSRPGEGEGSYPRRGGRFKRAPPGVECLADLRWKA